MILLLEKTDKTGTQMWVSHGQRVSIKFTKF